MPLGVDAGARSRSFAPWSFRHTYADARSSWRGAVLDRQNTLEGNSILTHHAAKSSPAYGSERRSNLRRRRRCAATYFDEGSTPNGEFYGGAGGNRTTTGFLSTGFTGFNYRQNRSKLYGFAGFRTIPYKILAMFAANRSALESETSGLILHAPHSHRLGATGNASRCSRHRVMPQRSHGAVIAAFARNRNRTRTRSTHE
jgi:hypothetical protein